MKIIDLLRLVYKKKAPKKILYRYCEYEFCEVNNDYKNKDNLNLFEYLFSNEDEPLNFEIEIIEDKPKKIDKIKPPANWGTINQMSLKEHRVRCNHNFKIIFETVNEVINATNYLLENCVPFGKEESNKLNNYIQSISTKEKGNIYDKEIENEKQ